MNSPPQQTPAPPAAGQLPSPAAEVSRSRSGASRAPSAPLRGRYATLDSSDRSQDRAPIRGRGPTGHGTGAGRNGRTEQSPHSRDRYKITLGGVSTV
jgi:hypothetical protein